MRGDSPRLGPLRPVQSTVDTRESLPPQDGQWLRALKAEVQPTTFKKGREVAETRRVFGLQREGDRIRAQVAGSSGERYEVALEPKDGKVTSRCSCPSWNTYGPHCKHVVAAALIYAARFRPPPKPAASPAPATPPSESKPVEAAEPADSSEAADSEEELAVPELSTLGRSGEPAGAGQGGELAGALLAAGLRVPLSA